MSTIESLSIQGIRSFGSKEYDKQSINFSSPLTLILGENGSGKTTIIECLKYALTGDVPPGSNRGQNFVHDPKIFNYIECLGQVKLLVKNIRGEKLTVTRSMKLGQKRGKPSFETLDATVNYEGKNGADAMSKRCFDVDTELCQFMGVSKAIINNVIFCHQEDSSWPLDEPKKLKEKFDAIFGTSDYNKAIDKIMKLRKEQQDELKVKEANLKYLNHIKKETEDKTLDLENSLKKLANLQEMCSKYETEIEPIEENLSKFYKIEMEAGKLQSQRIEISTKLKNCKDQIQNLSSKIKNIFDGNIHQLDRELRNFKEKMDDRKSELQNLEDLLTSLRTQEKRLQDSLTELDRKNTSLINKRQQEQDYIAERATKISELCGELGITVNNNLEEASNEEISNILKSIKEYFIREEKKITDLSSDHDKQDHEMQSKIDKLRENKASTEADMATRKAEKDQLEREDRTLDAKIKSTQKEAEQLNNLLAEIEKVEKLYENFSQTINLDEIKKNIGEKRKNIDTLQVQVEEFDTKLTLLNSISKLLAEINLKEKELEKREQEIRRVKNKHSDNFKNIFPNRTIDTNFKRNLQNAYDDLQRCLKEFNAKVNAAKLKERELQLMRKNQKEKLIKSEKELEDIKEKIFDKCRSVPYEELLFKCKETIQKLQLDLGAFKSAESMYKKYIKKIEDDPCCPLCHKNMSSNEAADLSSELSDEIHRLPDNIKRTETLLKQEQIKYEGLLSLKPLLEKVEYLEEEIPKRKNELKSTEENLAESSNDVENFQMLASEPTANIELINSMFGDMSLLDEALKDASRLRADLEKLKTKLPEGSQTSTTIEEVQASKTAAATELKNERSEVDTLQTKYEKESETLNKLREKRNRLKDRQIKLQEDVQALSQLKIRKTEIKDKLSAIQTQNADLNNKVQSLRSDLETCIKEKNRVKDENRKILNEATKKLDRLRKIDHDIQRYNTELKSLKELNLVHEIEHLQATMKKHLQEQKVKAEENTRTVAQIDKVKSELSNQEMLERNLRDNKELKMLQQKEKQFQDQLDELSADMGELDYKNVAAQKKELTAKRDTITVKKGEILGQMGEINNQKNKLQAELNDTKYKDSIKNFRKNMYEVEVLKRLISDLGHYRMALEWALMKFHTEKMEKINRLIREFWRQIYRGNDIDFIQIQTDEMATNSIDKRRSYSYRVVQSKNGSQIDMRGRCSAGQRVLASLIIRMALAETFSCNCGVLALDEPTTNLDRSNIISLCEALNKIVEERQSQSNFMLVIITHDEQFISTLGRIRNYYKVFRDDEGKSVIRKVRIV